MIRLLHLYVIRQFVLTVGFSLGALSTVFIIVDMFERLDAFIDNSAPIEIILTYYSVYLPSIFELLVPISCLLGALFSIGRLSNNNEIVAMRSAGMGLFQLILPILLFCVFLSIGQLFFNGWVVPRSVTQKLNIEREYLAGDGYSSTLNDLYFRESATTNVSIQRYDGSSLLGYGIAVEEFGSQGRPRILWRIDAPQMQWDTTSRHWIAREATRRTFVGDTVLIDQLTEFQIPLEVGHTQIVRLQRNVDELTFTEMADYILTMKRGGRDTRRQEIDLSGQWAFPFVNVIVVLIAVPFASVRRRGGMAVNIAAAMVTAIAYIAFTKISQSIGVATVLPVEVVGWSANVIFLLVGVLIYARTRT